MSTLRIILNGKSAKDRRLREAVSTLREEGHSVEVRVTWEAGDVQRLTEEALGDAKAGGLDTIVAAGGDGTVNEVFAAALAGKIPAGCTFGIVPLGTANDFARSAGLPVDDLTAALRMAVETKAVAMDVGLLDGKVFINLATGGFGAKVTAETDPELKRRMGSLAYALTGIARLKDLSANVGRFRAEGFEWEGSFAAMAIGNGRQAGGGIPLCPEATIDDGLLDLAILAEPDSEPGAGAMVRALLDRLSGAGGLALTAKSRWVEYESAEELDVNLDGEPVRKRGFRVECRPAAIRVHLGASPLLGGRRRAKKPRRRSGA
jgi:lipid kinase YegS